MSKILYSEYIRSLDIIFIEELFVDAQHIYAQYNYDRFKKWRSLFHPQENDVLNMKLSPHVDFLRSYEETGGEFNIFETRYYKMHILYGKDKAWIRKKIDGFISLYEYIKDGNEVDAPIILTSPISVNPYNRGYEIYEGHHRVSIYTFLNKDKIKVRLSEWMPKI